MESSKRVSVLILLISLVIGLSGCSGGGGLGSSERTLSKSFTADSDAIWYDITRGFDDELGKDSAIRTVFVFKDGELSVYDTYLLGKELSLGDVAQKSDEEVITMLEGYEEEMIDRYENYLANVKTGCDYILSKGEFDAKYTDQKKVLEQISSNLVDLKFVEEPQKFKLVVYTDSTGNSTEKEVIVFSHLTGMYSNLYTKLAWYADVEHQSDISKSDITLLTSDIKNDKSLDRVTNTPLPGDDGDPTTFEKPLNVSSLELEGSLDSAPKALLVYDTNYDGYTSAWGCALVTRSTGGSFILDAVGSEGVLVDSEIGYDILGF
ncbi:hypothetical protein [Acetobacterium wieringae]|uniref:hypothetical protein n=1 Tax=Acetobacterium wieringae TaxID=52694 RepID=UPI002B1FCE67|nr:hypothetical protein [Acetobacterium wieringae]MEA4805365.1 hypothetical protein [Acetobacterium wieringae]